MAEKIKVYDVTTGEALEVFHIDAKEHVASGHYTYENPADATVDRAEVIHELDALGVNFDEDTTTEALVALLEQKRSGQ